MNFRIIHILLLLSSLVLKAENFGSITGTISDSDKGIELPGVNIMVKGTYYGSSSDLEGRYRLNDISPGSYDIEVSMIGYKIILKTGVLVEAGKTITIDFKMEETVLSFGEDVIVMG